MFVRRNFVENAHFLCFILLLVLVSVGVGVVLVQLDVAEEAVELCNEG